MPLPLPWDRRDFLKAGVSLTATALSPADLHAAPDEAAPSSGRQDELRIQRLSWAGLKLESPGATLFIDPFISAEGWGGDWKAPIVPLTVSTPRRSVLITHRHTDHFDTAALSQLISDQGDVICHTALASYVAGQGFRVKEVELYKPFYFTSEIMVMPVPAVDGVGSHQVSWIVSGGGKRIIHCGDTLWHGQFWRIGQFYGPFDAAFLPINGPKLKYILPFSDVPAAMTPEQAVAAAVVLGAKQITPIHYGLESESYVEYPNAEATLIEVARQREVPVEIVEPGDWVQWKPQTR